MLAGSIPKVDWSDFTIRLASETFVACNFAPPCFCAEQTVSRTILDHACASFETRVASKTSKTTSAWWLGSNLRSVPSANKCQVNHKLRKDKKNRATLTRHKAGLSWIKTKASPTQTWIAYCRLAATHNLAASLFFTTQTVSSTLSECVTMPRV